MSNKYPNCDGCEFSCSAIKTTKRNGTQRKRDGCWFCPNQKIPELAELKLTRPDLWAELKLLSKVENTIARGFKYGETFDEIEAQVDYYIENPPAEQLSLFDYIYEEV